MCHNGDERRLQHLPHLTHVVLLVSKDLLSLRLHFCVEKTDRRSSLLCTQKLMLLAFADQS